MDVTFTYSTDIRSLASITTKLRFVEDEALFGRSKTLAY